MLLADQAGWHMLTRLVVPPNITVMALPPKSPELNPVENVWQLMRENWLYKAGRINRRQGWQSKV